MSTEIIPCTLDNVNNCTPKRDFATVTMSWKSNSLTGIPDYFDCNNCGFRIRNGKEAEVDEAQRGRFLKQEKVLSDRTHWHK